MAITREDRDRAAKNRLAPISTEDVPSGLVKISDRVEGQGTPKEILVTVFKSPDLITYVREVYPDAYVDRQGLLQPTQWAEEGKEPAWFRDARTVERKVTEPVGTLTLTDKGDFTDDETGDRTFWERYRAADGTIYRKELVEKVREARITTPFLSPTVKKKETTWYQEPKSSTDIVTEDLARSTPKSIVSSQTCPKCKSLLDKFGKCALCDRRRKEVVTPEVHARELAAALAPRKHVVEKGRQIPGVWETDVKLLDVLKIARRKLVPAILRGEEDLYKRYDFDGIAEGNENIWYLLILWSEAWQHEDVAEALAYISPEQELLILDDFTAWLEELAKSNKALDSDSAIELYADSLLKFRAEQIIQGREREQAVYSAGTTPRLPPRSQEEKIVWRGIPSLTFRDFKCPHCGGSNIDPGDGRAGMRCRWCNKTFNISAAVAKTKQEFAEIRRQIRENLISQGWKGENLEREFERAISKVPQLGIFRPAHKGEGPATRLPIPGAPGSIPGSYPALKRIFKEMREAKDEEKTRGKRRTKSQKRAAQRRAQQEKERRERGGK